MLIYGYTLKFICMVSIKNCKQEICPVKKDGKCLEGLPIGECPHFYFTDSDEEKIDDSIEIKLKQAETRIIGVPLFEGIEFTLATSSIITYEFFSKTVFILGDSDSGKTTLIATLFDLFQKGPIKNLYFAGSYTQIGFETRCHLSRINSNANEAETEKTNTKELSFLHLALKHKESLNELSSHFLVSDISGERLQIARDSSSAMRELSLLKDSDKIIVIIDGNKLSNNQTRELALFNTYTFIKRALDENIFSFTSDIKIIISKCDLLNLNSSENFEETVENYFSSKFPELFNLTFAKIAARPRTTTLEFKFGHGLYELIEDWFVDKSIFIQPKASEKKTNHRWFLNYKN